MKHCMSVYRLGFLPLRSFGGWLEQQWHILQNFFEFGGINICQRDPVEQKNDTSNWCWNFNFFDLFVVGSESSNVGSGHGWRILWNIFL